MRLTIECDFTPAQLDQIEFGLGQTLLHLDGNAFPVRADAVQDALEIVCGLRSTLLQTRDKWRQEDALWAFENNCSRD
jgi:hypothetical protein